jgi:hypothetical protein
MRPRPLRSPARPSRVRGRALGSALLLLAPLLGACASAVPPHTLAPNPVESLIALPAAGPRGFPVYWLGASFQGLPLTEVLRDRGGAVTVAYGECLRGGQYTCVVPLTVVTSPDNSFRPHGTAAMRVVMLRGVRSYSAARGLTVEVPTGSVVVSIYAQRPGLARAAARAMVPLNTLGLPGAPLPAPGPQSSFATSPLTLQLRAPKPESEA